MREIIGNTTATPNPKPDWNQTDETKADYIKNKPDINSKLDKWIPNNYQDSVLVRCADANGIITEKQITVASVGYSQYNAIPLYDHPATGAGGGALTTSTPKSSKHAANKEYVDKAITNTKTYIDDAIANTKTYVDDTVDGIDALNFSLIIHQAFSDIVG